MGNGEKVKGNEGWASIDERGVGLREGKIEKRGNGRRETNGEVGEMDEGAT